MPPSSQPEGGACFRLRRDNGDDLFAKIVSSREEQARLGFQVLLGGSWVVIVSGVIIRVAIVITHIKRLKNPTYNYPMNLEVGFGSMN